MLRTGKTYEREGFGQNLLIDLCWGVRNKSVVPVDVR